MQKKKNAINWYVFLPTLIVVGGAAILGLVSNKMLTEVSYAVFAWTLQTFAWLYESIGLIACILLFAIFSPNRVVYGLEGRKQRQNFLLLHGLQ